MYMTTKKIITDFKQESTRMRAGLHVHVCHIYVIYECVAFKMYLLHLIRVSEKSIVSCAFARGVGAALRLFSDYVDVRMIF